MSEADSQPLLSVRDLVKKFGGLQAISGVSFDLIKGETLGLVGESGCGKSTLGKCILRLIEPDAGSVLFKDSDSYEDIRKFNTSRLRKLRKKMQMIFQDPYASLNPKMTLEQTLSEPLDIHNLCNSKKEKKQKINRLLELCELSQTFLSRYPYEFSGGQRQRICIARALAVEPEFIVCDEAVSSLDVSIQFQIIKLLQNLQREFQLTYLFISHDLKIVSYLSSRIAVMYLGKIVEMTTATNFYKNPKHPYTKALLSAVPVFRSDKRKEKTILKGEVPSPYALPGGCQFHPRCPIAQPNCSVDSPQLRDIDSKQGSHVVSCHYVN